MITRESLQQKAVDLLHSHKRLICQWATSVGKSMVVLKFLKEYHDKGEFPPTLIFVPEQDNIENWYEEFEKYGVGTMNVTIACYASMHKYIGTEYELLVLDEAPHTDTALRSEYLSTIYAEYVLALGAVISVTERMTLESLFGKFCLHNVSLNTAIKNNILPSPQIRILHMELEDIKTSYIVDGKRFSAKDGYSYINSKVKMAMVAFKNNQSEWNRLSLHRAGLARKKFLGELKEGAVREVCEQLNMRNKRYLCFCNSIKQAETLGGNTAFTSKTAKSAKKLDLFNNKKINSLYVVGKLIEGQNLKDIDCGIICQLGGTKRITVQECGRIMRAQNPVIYVTVFNGTKDEDFLKDITKSIPGEYIKHYKFKTTN